MCEYYIYDDEYDYYYCDMELDEDEMYDFVTGNFGDCHYFRYRNAGFRWYFHEPKSPGNSAFYKSDSCKCI